MDEPLGALDRQLRESLQLEIKALTRRLGLAVVYVTHDQDEALIMSDRIAVYHDGTIEQIGTGEDLYERPASAFVAGFIGESNLIRGVLRTTGGVWEVMTTGGPIQVTPPADVAMVGRNAVVVVRPEDVRLITGADDTPQGRSDLACRISGRVTQLVYLGPFRKYVIETDSGRFMVRELSAVPGKAVVGDAVAVGWAVARSRTMVGE
jgi:putative spermidine/putrescine transport system ATP-binding protein